MKPLQSIASTAVDNVRNIVGDSLSPEQSAQVADIIEDAVIKALLEGQHRAVDAALQCPDADQDLTHKIAREIRQKNDVLIANLTSLR
jgi:hypothetical protein